MYKYITPFIVGFFFLALYLLQYLLGLHWEWLQELQEDQMYRRWSGVFLGTVILMQWLLTIARVIPKLRPLSIKLVRFHKWVGAFSPLFYYVHSMSFGFAYLFGLSVLFFTNMVLGTVNLDIVKSRKEWIFQTWMIAHVLFSVVITFIVVYHIGVVFYYK